MSISTDAATLIALVQAPSLSLEERAMAITLYGRLSRSKSALPLEAKSIRRWTLTEPLLRGLCEVASTWADVAASEQQRAQLAPFIDAMTLLLVQPPNAELLRSYVWRAFVGSHERGAADELLVPDGAVVRTATELSEAPPPDGWVNSLVANGVDVARLPEMLRSSTKLRAVLDELIAKRLRAGEPVALSVLCALSADGSRSTARLPVRPSARWAADSASSGRRSIALGRLAPLSVDARLVCDRGQVELRLLAARGVIAAVRFAGMNLRAPSSSGPGPNETWSIVTSWPRDPVELVVETSAARFEVSLELAPEDE
jgi:hypothetical protein